MRVFISGGCKNGKSYHAQRIAKNMYTQGAKLYYIATMLPADGEDEERIRRHRRERMGWGFETFEIPRDIASILEICDTAGTFLLDSMTALLANEMFPIGDEAISGACDKICGDMSEILQRIGNIVIVSDYIYSDACIYDAATENYRQSLAHIDRFVAKRCDIVLEAAFGNITAHRGGDKYAKIV